MASCTTVAQHELGQAPTIIIQKFLQFTIRLCARALKATIQKSIWQRFSVPKLVPRLSFSASWDVLGPLSGSEAALVVPGGVLGYLAGPVGVPWGSLGRAWGVLWHPLGCLWVSLGVPWGSLGAAWSDLMEWFQADVRPRWSRGALLWIRDGPGYRLEGLKY